MYLSLSICFLNVFYIFHLILIIRLIIRIYFTSPTYFFILTAKIILCEMCKRNRFCLISARVKNPTIVEVELIYFYH